MAIDTLQLGPFIFENWSPPDRMGAATKQQLNVHKMPGGYRVVDVMGPDDQDPCWSGVFHGEGALTNALTLYAMCQAGQELAFSWAAESRTVVIADFRFDAQKLNFVHYEIRLTYTDDSGSGGLIGGIGLDGMVAADLGAALALF